MAILSKPEFRVQTLDDSRDLVIEANWRREKLVYRHRVNERYLEAYKGHPVQLVLTAFLTGLRDGTAKGERHYQSVMTHIGGLQRVLTEKFPKEQNPIELFALALHEFNKRQPRGR